MRVCVALLTTATVSACAASGQSTVRSDERPSQIATSTTSPSASPSTSAQVGLRTKRADVDGDGRQDRLAFWWLRRSAEAPFKGALKLTVHLAAGGSTSIVVPVADWIDRFHQERPTLPFSAAAQLNAAGGSEVVIDVMSTPASYAGYRVVTYDAGRLEFLSAPPQHGWLVGGSVGTGGHTYDCRGRRLVAIDAAPIRKGRNHDVVAYRVIRTSYVWTRGSWKNVDRQVNRGAGPSGRWECPALAGWAG